MAGGAEGGAGPGGGASGPEPGDGLGGLLAACRTRSTAAAVAGDLREACAGDPALLNHSSAASQVLRVLGLARDLEGVRWAWERAVGMGKPEPVARAAHAIALGRCGRGEEAEDELRTLIRVAQEGVREDGGSLDEAATRSVLLASTSLVTASVRRRDFAAVDRVLRVMEDAGTPPGPQILSALLPHHARFGGLDALLAVMERHQIVLDQYGFTALLLVHAKQGRAKEAATLLEVMRCAGCSPGQHAYNLLIEACGRGGRLAAALQGYREMLEHGVRPSPHTYNGLYRAISSTASGLKEANQPESGTEEGTGEGTDGVVRGGLGAAEGRATPDGAGTGVQDLAAIPDSGEAKDFEECLWSLERDRQQRGIQHSVQSFTALIQALDHLGLTPRILAHVEEATAKRSPRLDTVAFNVALGACMRAGEVSQGFRMYDLMLQQGLRPSLHTYNALVNGCAEAREPSRALEVLESIWAAGREPNQVTLNTLVKAFVLVGDPEGAAKIVAQLGARCGLLPSPHALDMLIGECEQQRRHDVIDSLYDALATVDTDRSLEDI